MFSSNQEFTISGDMSQLGMALDFAMKFSEQLKHTTPTERERGCKICFQITKDGKYCVGWGFKDVPDGWTEYQFDYDTKIVAKIIAQYLMKQPRKESEYDYFDGGTKIGFIMKSPRSEHTDSIENPFFCIVYFEQFINFYAK